MKNQWWEKVKDQKGLPHQNQMIANESRMEEGGSETHEKSVSIKSFKNLKEIFFSLVFPSPLSLFVEIWNTRITCTLDKIIVLKTNVITSTSNLNRFRRFFSLFLSLLSFLFFSLCLSLVFSIRFNVINCIYSIRIGKLFMAKIEMVLGSIKISINSRLLILKGDLPVHLIKIYRLLRAFTSFAFVFILN